MASLQLVSMSLPLPIVAVRPNGRFCALAARKGNARWVSVSFFGTYSSSAAALSALRSARSFSLSTSSRDCTGPADAAELAPSGLHRIRSAIGGALSPHHVCTTTMHCPCSLTAASTPRHVWAQSVVSALHTAESGSPLPSRRRGFLLGFLCMPLCRS